MENMPKEANEQKLTYIMKYAPIGLSEIDSSGKIISLNIVGEKLLQPVIETNNLTTENLFPILQFISPEMVDNIKNFKEENGVIFQNIVYSFCINNTISNDVKYYTFTATKVFHECIMVSCEDITQKQKDQTEILHAQVDKEIEQGKYEIASSILHDIGNAIVGFGSYLTKTKRLQEQISLENVTNLSIFFKENNTVIAKAIGADKADAVVAILNNIAEKGKSAIDEMKKAISEQGNIITHIQEILNIQRQYVAGQDSSERKLTNLRNIINDCMAMLFASFEKRGIYVTINVANDIPKIKGDRTKLMQVILNVLKNSLEAIDISAPKKTVSVNVSLETPSTVAMIIQDSGEGFDAHIASNLFKRGFTTKLSGTGLGLYNCKQIIESHNGTIEISSDGKDKGCLTVIKLKI